MPSQIAMEVHLSDFAYILLFVLGGVLFILGGLFTAYLIRPDRPNPEKLSIYESGEETIGSARGSFNARFYILALMFILFEVEILFLFPWSTVFGRADLIKGTDGLWAKVAIFEMYLFIGILVLGLAYVWAKGYLDWAKTAPKKNEIEPITHIPREAYSKYLK